LQGAKCAISGGGNVAQYAALMLIKQGAKVMTMSDSNGVLVFPNGMTEEDWKQIAEAKQVHRQRFAEIADKVSGYYVPEMSPWTLSSSKTTTTTDISYDFAFPCATQNEIDKDGIITLIERCKVKGIFEGANIPITLEGQAYLREHQNKGSSSNNNDIIYIPGKAANAGGVGVSGFEMSQNAQKLTWDSNAVDEKLQGLMQQIYNQLKSVAGDSESLEVGANQAGFLKLVNAMDDLGWLGDDS